MLFSSVELTCSRDVAGVFMNILNRVGMNGAPCVTHRFMFPLVLFASHFLQISICWRVSATILYIIVSRFFTMVSMRISRKTGSYDACRCINYSHGVIFIWEMCWVISASDPVPSSNPTWDGWKLYLFLISVPIDALTTFLAWDRRETGRLFAGSS